MKKVLKKVFKGAFYLLVFYLLGVGITVLLLALFLPLSLPATLDGWMAIGEQCSAWVEFRWDLDFSLLGQAKGYTRCILYRLMP